MRAPSTKTLPWAQAPPETYDLKLYVAGHTLKSRVALANLKRFCKEHMDGRYRIEVIDLMRHPQRAREDEILAIPTLVRKLPPPIRKIIGDLSRTERVLVGLGLSTPRPSEVSE